MSRWIIDLTQRHFIVPCAVVVQARLECVAFQQFQHDVVDIILHVRVEDLDDVGVTQPSYRPRLAPEADQEFLIFHQVRAQHLDRHVAIELWVVGSVDAGHATAPQRFQYTIFTERLSF
jgi:hypothetical protein